MKRYFVLAGAALLAGSAVLHAQGEPAARVPAPLADLSARSGLQTLVVSGGCFWGVQGVFEHVHGVQKAVSGYAGGSATTAFYETVSGGDTGHAESVQITYDPSVISFGKLLQVFFSVALDPTEVDRQGPDEGTQYRSEIWVKTGDEARIAKAYVAQLEAAHVFARPIATRVDTLPAFYPAEGYHQDFLERHPSYPYIVINDMPKVRALQALFPDVYVAPAHLTEAGS